MTNSFQINKFIEYHDWKPIIIDSSVPFDVQHSCPCDNSPLEVIARLKSPSVCIRIGCCGFCGYVGYIDRPTEKWMSDFYALKWDVANESATKGRLLKSMLPKDKRRKKFDLPYITNFLKSADKLRYILDLGAGYGGTMKLFQKFGYTNIVGVENSLHRAALGREIYGVEIIAKPFERAEIELLAFAPFSLVYSFHVIEHVYNPMIVVKQIARLQKEGDLLVIATPSLDGESSMSTMLYLPHLHTYSEEAMETLLQNNGYTIIDDHHSTRELYFVARRSEKKISRVASGQNHIEIAKKKIITRLGLDKYKPGSRKILYWYRSVDIAGTTPKFLLKFRPYLTFLHNNEIIARAGRRGLEGRHSFQAAEVIFQNPSDVIEISFPKDIIMTYK